MNRDQRLVGLGILLVALVISAGVLLMLRSLGG